MSESAVSEGLKAAGAASVIATTVAGFTMQDWAALAALVWTLWMLFDKAWDKFTKWQMRRHARIGDAARRKQVRRATRIVRERDGE